eukprot:TRINITY_DN10244_c0_g1_i2.p1 TRINITY_DN10244_c0_g1~~TRINITY_DN10244_c0_g1_i2.p1  ORF type:complete len:433 (-),score=69.90 TRINITY_DN10244_c0_g1_i2:668-1966(-)
MKTMIVILLVLVGYCVHGQGLGEISPEAYNQLFGNGAIVNVQPASRQSGPLNTQAMPSTNPMLFPEQQHQIQLGNLSLGSVPEKQVFRFGHAGPLYPGWFPFPYAFEQGIADEVGKKYGANIEDFGITSVIKSMVQFVSGEIDAVIMSMMDAQLLPLVELFQKQVDEVLGIQSVRETSATAVLVGSWSNGNDGIISTKASSVEELVDTVVHLDAGTSYFYFLYRALEQGGVDPALVEIREMDVLPRFEAFMNGEIDTIVIMEPLLSIALNVVPDAKLLWTSDSIPFEIIDMIVMHDWIVEEHPEVPQTLVEAWYDANNRIIGNETLVQESFEWFSTYANLTFEEVSSMMLNTTYMFWDPSSALDFIESEQFQQSIQRIRNYIFSQGIFQGIYQDEQEIGIAINETIIGNPVNIKLKIDPSFTQQVQLLYSEQ